MLAICSHSVGKYALPSPALLFINLFTSFKKSQHMRLWFFHDIRGAIQCVLIDWLINYKPCNNRNWIFMPYNVCSSSSKYWKPETTEQTTKTYWKLPKTTKNNLGGGSSLIWRGISSSNSQRVMVSDRVRHRVNCIFGYGGQTLVMAGPGYGGP